MRASARQTSECASLAAPVVAYWQSKEDEPEICLSRPAAMKEFNTGAQAPIVGVSDFCARLRKVTP
jgi:hypothetical protein